MAALLSPPPPPLDSANTTVKSQHCVSSASDAIVLSPSSSGSLMDNENEYGSSDVGLTGEDALEVSDWVRELSDAVLTVKKSELLSPSSESILFIRINTTGSHTSQTHHPSAPNHQTTSNSSLSTWLSRQEDADDEMEFEYEPLL